MFIFISDVSDHKIYLISSQCKLGNQDGGGDKCFEAHLYLNFDEEPLNFMQTMTCK